MTKKEQTEDINAKIDDILRGSGLDATDFPAEEETNESPNEETNEPPTEETNEDITPDDDGGHDEVEISDEEEKPKKSPKGEKAKKPAKKPAKPKDKKPKEEKPLTEKEKAWKARHAAWVEFEKAKKQMPEWITFKRLKDEYIAKYGNE